MTTTPTPVPAPSSSPLEQLLEEFAGRSARVLDQFVAGLENRYYVRAALDSRYVDDVDELLREIRTGRAPGLSALSPEHRRRVELAAMRGWAEHHPGPPAGVEVLAWHRQLGHTRVLVGRSAP